VLTIYYRADLLKKIHRTPPKTWIEYQETARLLAAEKKSTPESPWSGTLEPLAPGWAGVMLLARAAPYVKHRNNYSTWFDSKTMEPLIAEPPVVQALTELVAAAKTNAGESMKCDPAAVRNAFWAGQCGMAISWPTARTEKNAENGTSENKEEKEAKSEEKTAAKESEFEAGFVELPGSRKAYDVNNQRWEARQEDESSNVSLLGFSGRMGVVSAKSSSRDAAFTLLVWLSDAKNSPQICPLSASTTLFRKSHLEKPKLWTEKQLAPPAAKQYAESAAATLESQACVDFRLHSGQEYLAALDEAVQDAFEGKSPPADALSQAAEKWRQITDKLGKDRQKTAYLHSLGLD
jgi:multiple sugar transport system substrate-binding protein